MTAVWRWVFLAHRYIGIGVGVFVLLWCLSGFVMMYVPFPTLDKTEYLAGLDPLELDQCCDPRTLSSYDAVTSVASFRAEMWNGAPILRATLTSGEPVTFSLTNGQELKQLELADIRAEGLRYGRRAGYISIDDAAPIVVRNERIDQWTVPESFNRHRPMSVFSSRAGIEWYISNRTGEVVLSTYPGERFANWFGAVPHWLYPALLRQNGALWSTVVIWLTLVSLFLVLTGTVWGVRQLRGRFLGLSLWHHYSGLVSGVFLLIWLFSGLVSMNPWGAFQSRSFETKQTRLWGPSVTLAEIYRFLTESRVHVPPGAVQLTSSIRKGAIAAAAFDVDGSVRRVDAKGVLANLSHAEVESAATRMRPQVPIASITTLTAGDAYYYDHHTSRPFPVHRAIYVDGERFYFDVASGAVVLAVDAGRAGYRWLFRALHTGDFHALARSRPLWDIWMLIVLIVMTGAAVTGAAIAYRYVKGSK